MAASAPLRQPAFRSLWLAGLVSEAGDWLLFIALPIVVYRLTGSALGASFAFLAQLGPSIVLSPFAGRLADRLDRRTVMLVVTALQAVALAPLLLVGGDRGLAIVYGVIVVQSALAALFDPAKNAMLPTLVDAEQLIGANALVALDEGVGRLVGGPLGGLLLAAGDLHAVVLADAVSYAIAGMLIARVPAAPGPPSGVAAAGVPASGVAAAGVPASGVAAAGGPTSGSHPVRAVLRHRPVRGALLVAFFADIAQGIFLVLFIVFVAQRLRGDSAQIGLLRGVQAIGAIAAGLILARRGRRRSAVRLTGGAALAFGGISLLLWNLPALTTSLPVYATLFAIVGAPGVVMVTGMITFLQESVPAGQRGRAFGALAMAQDAGTAVGMVAAGVLTGPLGLRPVLDVQAGIYLATGLALARALRPGAVRAERSRAAPA